MIQAVQYVRKPFRVEAVQVTEENLQQVADWCHGEVRTKQAGKKLLKYVKVRVHLPLKERQTTAFVGDWILYAANGFKVYTQNAFDRNFEVAADQLKSVSDENQASIDAVGQGFMSTDEEIGSLVEDPCD